MGSPGASAPLPPALAAKPRPSPKGDGIEPAAPRGGGSVDTTLGVHPAGPAASNTPEEIFACGVCGLLRPAPLPRACPACGSGWG